MIKEILFKILFKLIIFLSHLKIRFNSFKEKREAKKNKYVIERLEYILKMLHGDNQVNLKNQSIMVAKLVTIEKLLQGDSEKR